LGGLRRMKAKEVITAKDVIKHLRLHFAAPSFAFLEQVADGTGARQHRWADAVAMSVWPSRGFDIHGVEVKVSRYDWQKELAQPQKSAAEQQYCNRWWIATSDDTIIHPGELPPTWGWMVIKKEKGMRVITEAPGLKPLPVSVEFVASVLRNFGAAEEVAVERRIRKAVEEAREETRSHDKTRYETLRKSVDEFQIASGIDLKHAWDAGDIGSSVETLRSLRYKVQIVQSGINACEDIKGMLEKVLTLAMLQDDAKKENAA
jgi:hypothetical protein